MAAYIFQDIAAKGAKLGIQRDSSKKSIDWFRGMAQTITRVSPQNILSDKENSPVTTVSKSHIGSLLFYSYNPKGKDTLPFYDKFPLVFISDLHSDGWSGLNVHYLPPYLRAKLMDALYKTAINKNDPENMKLAISYKILNSIAKSAQFGPCYKKYLAGHVVSPIRRVSSENWDLAVMLPLQRFAKKSAQEVWTESMKTMK
jgi:hypothetical protein